MGAKLHIQPAKIEAFELPIGNTATIGRTRENTVCLNFSPLVSRQHALIRCHNSYQYQIIDLGSRNGTYVNEQRVVMPVTLAPGAQIRIADNTITFLEEDAHEGGEHLELTVAATNAGTALVTRSVALLVCDIRGFSTMSEKMPSGAVAQLIGEWFRETGNLVQRTTGTVDKFIGDAVLAYWGLAQDGPTDCGGAYDVAQQLLKLAGARKWPNGEPLRVAIALHYGRVTCSNVGLAAERDFTIVGDAVNTVFRLEVVSKALSRPVVLSDDFARHLPDVTIFEDCGEQQLKGKSQAVRIFAPR